MGSIFIFLWGLFTGKTLRPGSWKRIFQVVRATFFLYWLMTIFFFIGQQYVSATTASLFVESGPAFLLILWRGMTGKKPTTGEIISCVSGVIGCMLVLNIISPDGFGFSGSLFGVLFVFFSAVAWVIGSYYAKDVMQAKVCTVTTAWCQLYAALMTLPMMGIMHNELIFPTGWDTWLAIAAMGIFPTAIAFVAWGKAMSLLPLTKLNLTQNLTPVFTMIGAWLLIHEKIEWWNVVGMTIVFIGLSVSILCGGKKDAA